MQAITLDPNEKRALKFMLTLISAVTGIALPPAATPTLPISHRLLHPVHWLYHHLANQNSATYRAVHNGGVVYCSIPIIVGYNLNDTTDEEIQR